MLNLAKFKDFFYFVASLKFLNKGYYGGCDPIQSICYEGMNYSALSNEPPTDPKYQYFLLNTEFRQNELIQSFLISCSKPGKITLQVFLRKKQLNDYAI
jgi:hypothetical protein